MTYLTDNGWPWTHFNDSVVSHFDDIKIDRWWLSKRDINKTNQTHFSLKALSTIRFYNK